MRISYDLTFYMYYHQKFPILFDIYRAQDKVNVS
jgi:hypothetical protein